MLSLIVGSCIALDGFVWQIESKDRDTVKLAYLIPVRITDSPQNRMIMRLEKRVSVWETKTVKNTARSVRCPKEYEKMRKGK